MSLTGRTRLPDAEMPCPAGGRRAFLLLPLALALPGCGFISNSGPRSNAVMAGASQQSGDAGTPNVPREAYSMITLSPAVVARLARDARPSQFGANLLGLLPQATPLGMGDIVGVTIFEAQAGGLFIPAEPGARPGNFITLPAQQIDGSGTISVPFAGAIRAAGRTPAQIERTIIQRLAQRALEPQVVVSLQERRAAHVSVVGDVNQSLRFPLDPGGERLLGALARAMGPKFPTYETVLTLQRGGVSDQAILSDILSDPALNIELRSGDTVLVTREPRYFVALGAVGQTASITQLNRRITFDDRRLSLTEAIARAGGLQDDRANPSSVFLYRMENAQALRAAGIAVAPAAGETVPTIYRADFADPSMFFLAQRFPMRHEDTIFVSNAPATDLEKFLRLLLPLAQSAGNAGSI